MIDEKSVRIGIIGAGGIAQVSHIPNLSAVTSAELASICDANIGRAVSVADRFDVSEYYDDPEIMLKRAQLDCVVIATPTISHLPLCQTAFENGVDVMVEKPFARNYKEALRIVELAEDNGKLIMVGMNHRFREDTTLLKEILEKNDLGELFMVRSGWLKRLGVWGRPYWFTDPKLAGGGVLIDLGLQMIDVVMYILGSPTVVDVSCGLSNKLLGLEVEDTASVFLRFDNDVTFLLEVSWANCDAQDIAYTWFSGSQGSASINPMRMNRRQGDRIIAESVPVMADEVVLYRRSFQTEIAHFVDCVHDRNEPLSSGRSVLAAIEVVDKLYETAGR